MNKSEATGIIPTGYEVGYADALYDAAQVINQLQSKWVGSVGKQSLAHAELAIKRLNEKYAKAEQW